MGALQVVHRDDHNGWVRRHDSRVAGAVVSSPPSPRSPASSSSPSPSPSSSRTSIATTVREHTTPSALYKQATKEGAENAIVVWEKRGQARI